MQKWWRQKFEVNCYGKCLHREKEFFRERLDYYKAEDFRKGR